MHQATSLTWNRTRIVRAYVFSIRHHVWTRAPPGVIHLCVTGSDRHIFWKTLGAEGRFSSLLSSLTCSLTFTSALTCSFLSFRCLFLSLRFLVWSFLSLFWVVAAAVVASTAVVAAGCWCCCVVAALLLRFGQFYLFPLVFSVTQGIAE